MNISDVLRKVADAIEQEQNESTSPNGTTESGNDRAPEVFLPPLQQKQELLKKAVGVDNVYDDGTSTQQAEMQESNMCDQERADIVNRIKQLSGIPTAAIFGLTDDEPLDE